MRRAPDISVIVPVHNESDLVPALVFHLRSLGARETIVVDGGSTDGTWERLQQVAVPSLHCLRTDAGRARQMNTGALGAGGDVLLFLHADTRLPPGALARVAEGFNHNPANRWGRFDVRFDRSGPVLKVVALAMNLRSALTSICTGDQAIFVLREEFLELGGFAPIALMEDIEMSRRLRRRSRPLRIREPAITSARRWRAQGVWRTIIWMWWLRWLYWWGVPARALGARYYGKTR